MIWGLGRGLDSSAVVEAGSALIVTVSERGVALPLALEPFRGGGDSTEALDVDAFAELVSLVPFALDLASFFDLLLEAAAGAFVAFEELGSLG